MKKPSAAKSTTRGGGTAPSTSHGNSSSGGVIDLRSPSTSHGNSSSGGVFDLRSPDDDSPLTSSLQVKTTKPRAAKSKVSYYGGDHGGDSSSSDASSSSSEHYDSDDWQDYNPKKWEQASKDANKPSSKDDRKPSESRKPAFKSNDLDNDSSGESDGDVWNMDSVPAFVSRKHLVDGQTNVETAQEQVAIAESLQASNRTIVSVQDTLDNTPAPRLLSLFRHGQRVYLHNRDGTWRPGTIERREFGEGFSSDVRIGVVLDGETIFGTGIKGCQ